MLLFFYVQSNVSFPVHDFIFIVLLKCCFFYSLAICCAGSFRQTFPVFVFSYASFCFAVYLMICSRDSFAFFPLRSLVIHFVHTVCSLFEPLCVCVLCPHCANIEKEKLRDLCFRFCFILFLFLSLHSFIRSLVRSVAACISKLICIQFHCN